ncbi:N-formylglutamate amidohydrolase [Alteriqipengyuania flavescens]|uniref:N-formylglutamate amidohydrolase n=1 Tax=Alteriqipengyuania flavescens TaxID=3053610 RepID=UPI0025B45434|nr:N-formylglutamate amidohydrolase [Alteriqipengyuania flavescens]WJY18478.1 N-formylglutamate amidohydrolase [Alteriqipengyuania flavescens]WJY24419.1 N-formylglutamate amidohydrolase [Alteriqipengyuania flavescens]
MIDGQPYRQVGDVAPARIVLVADHASNFVPDEVELGIDPSLLDNHIAADIGVEGVADRLARRHGIPAHIACVSRLVCDLHREPDNPAAVPTTSDGHLIPGNIGADFDRRIRTYHAPYHDALAKWLDATNPALIISLHSFTPKLESAGEQREVEIGLLYNQDDRAARHAIRLFSEQNLNVGDNEPYSGKELNATMNRHAEAHGRPYCTIEIRNDLISTEAGQARFAAMIADIAGRVLLALETE